MTKIKLFLVIFVILTILCGCRDDSYRGVKPDDELSTYICNSIGDIFRYLGKEEQYDGAMNYEYYAPYESITVKNISLYMNSVTSLSVDKSEHIVFEMCPQIPDGSGGACSMQNYIELSDGDDKTVLEFSEMCVYTISYQDLSDPILTDPTTFTEVEGVRYLIVSKRMQEKADELGIDWYEIWPELEGVEYLSR